MNNSAKLMTRKQRAMEGSFIDGLLSEKDPRDQARIARYVLETFASNNGHTIPKGRFLQIHDLVNYFDSYAKQEEIEMDPELARQEWTVHPPNKERKS